MGEIMTVLFQWVMPTVGIALVLQAIFGAARKQS